MPTVECGSTTNVTWLHGDDEFTLAGNIHVWCLWLPFSVHRIDKAASFLSADEQVRAGKYFHERDRQRFMLSRAMLRIILSKYTGIDPREVKFSVANNKKPFVQQSDLQFNVSHSGSLVLIAVADIPVGIDVEEVNDTFDFNEIVPLCFSEAESAYIQQHGRPSFYQCWTRKEALVKASGNGLDNNMKSLPCLDGTHEITMENAANNKAWVVDSFDAHAGYKSSIAYPAPAMNMVCHDLDSATIDNFISFSENDSHT